VGVDHVLCCNSATSALMLALHWFGVGPGDEVIIPAYTYAATALAVIHAGARPVMADSGMDFNMDVSKLKPLITARTKAIIPVDIAGWPCDYDELNALVSSPEVQVLFNARSAAQQKLNRVFILSDAAHSFGAIYKSIPSGKLADMTVFSFHAVKNITTAEGGAICLNLPPAFDNRETYDTLRLWSLNGQTKDAFTKTTGGGWRYDIVYPGFKINMPDVLAAIGLAQYRKYDSELLPERKKIFATYADAFGKYDWAEIPQWSSGSKHSSCHLFPLKVKGISEAERDRMIISITEREVSVNVHFQPLPMLSYFRESGFSIGAFPVAYDLYAREISLPVYPGLTRDQIRFVVDAVAGAYNQVVKNEKAA
jgi:dTDP-4-amino-4,6-dideoxygalactose transaminase